MKFSVIVPTLGRIKEPIALLKSLLKQKCKDFEVILIDQNEENFLDSHVLEFSNHLQIKHVKSLKKGASVARNKGIDLAKGEILTFPDDDCELEPYFLEEVANYFNNNKVDGITVTSKDKFDGKAISFFMSKKKQVISRKNILNTVVEFGIIVKKESLKNVRFDPYMGVGSTLSECWSDEGPDLVLRLINIGLKFHYCPQYFMYHPNPVKKYTVKTIKRSYMYGKGRGYFLKKHLFGTKGISLYLFIYLIGMVKGRVFLNKNMYLYFKHGFKGRYEGYYK